MILFDIFMYNMGSLFSFNTWCFMQWSNNSFDWWGVWLERIESPLATLPDRVTQPMFYSRGPTLAAAFAIVQNIVFHKGIFCFRFRLMNLHHSGCCLFCETVPLLLVKTLVGRSIGKKSFKEMHFWNAIAKGVQYKQAMLHTTWHWRPLNAKNVTTF